MAWHSQVHSQLVQERHHQPLPPKPLFRTTGYRYQTVPAWAIVSYRSGNKIMTGTHSYRLIFQGLNWNYECKCVHFFLRHGKGPIANQLISTPPNCKPKNQNHQRQLPLPSKGALDVGVTHVPLCTLCRLRRDAG